MEEHAVETGKMIGAMGASYVGLLTLLTAPGTPIFEDMTRGAFQPLSTPEVLKELELILENADCKSPCVMRSNQHCFAGVFCCIVVKGSARTLAHILQAFAAVRHLY